MVNILAVSTGCDTMLTREQMMDNFSINIEKERKRLGFTQVFFAKALGISISTYKNIVSGKTKNLDIFLAFKIYELTGKPVHELLGYSPKEFEVLHKYRKLTDRQRAYILDKMDFEIAMQTLETEPKNMLDVLVLTGDLKDGMILDSSHEERVYCPEYIQKYGETLHCGIRITSNNLHPVYVKGDIICISKRPPRNGETLVVIHKPTGRAYIRRYVQGNMTKLKPINGLGDVIEVDPNSFEDMNQWVKFGVVIAVLRR